VERLKDEHGYAALVAIMVVLVLTLIGTNLLQTVMSSFTLLRKTESRGEAEYYARMGMDEAMARLQKVIDDVNAANKTTPAEIQAAFENQFATAFRLDADPSLSDDTSFTKTHTFDGVVWHTTGEPVRLTTGGVDASYQIYFRRETKQAGEAKSNSTPIDVPFVEKVTFRVIGKSHSPREEARALEAVVYVNTYPEELQYVLASKQDIVLNGAALIEGDTFSKGTYRLRNVAKLESPVKYNGQENSTTINSAYPSIIGQLGAEGVDKFYKDDSNDSITTRNGLQDAFSIAPTVGIYHKHTPAFSSVEDVRATVTAKTGSIPAELADPKTVIPDADVLAPAHLNGTYPNSVWVQDSHTVIEANAAAEINGDLLTIGKFEMLDRSASLLVKGGNVYIEGANDGTTSAYFRGNVAVEKGHYLAIKGDTVFENLMLDGIVYIEGNLTIQGQFDINGTLYVTGNVNITQDQDTSGIRNVTSEMTESKNIKASFETENASASISAQFATGRMENGVFVQTNAETSCSSPCQSTAQATGTTVVRLTISETDSDGSLLGREVYSFNETGLIDRTMVILTQGQVAAYNLNENKDTPKEIRAFLYSQVEPVTLYGICSHVQFIGGVYSAQTITLNAARSNQIQPLTCSGPDESGVYTITQSGVPTDPLAARLRLRFDYGMFETPPPGLPTSRTLRLKIMQYELDTFPAE
jgi:lipopolysaccharide export system protein LptA